MKREFSAGGIIFNDQGQVLLIKNAQMKDPSKSYWGFPKGHLEEGEDSQTAAIREVKEETGINVEVVSKLGDSRYIYTGDNQKIFKVVTVFILKVMSGELKIQPEEIIEAKWIDPTKALSILSFSNDKKLLNQALKLI